MHHQRAFESVPKHQPPTLRVPGHLARRIMLDFYLVNTTLEAGGNRVRATINGTEFMLDKWLPYMMEGLPAGENTVKLELVDASGTMIPGPFNSVTRTFTVAP